MLFLPGRRTRLNHNVSLTALLREGEAALEANFGNHDHKDAAQFHAIDGLVRAVPKHHEKSLRMDFM